MMADSTPASRSQDYGWRHPCLLETRVRSATHPIVVKRWLINHRWNLSLCIVSDASIWQTTDPPQAVEVSGHPLPHGSVDKQLSQHRAERRIANKQFRSLLGLEFDCLIYDAFAGIQADAIAALTGCLKAGGIFILYGPPLAEWHKFQDPGLPALLAYPATELPSSNFLRYLQSALNQHNGWNRLAFDQHRLIVNSATDSLNNRLRSTQAQTKLNDDALSNNAIASLPHQQCSVSARHATKHSEQQTCILKVMAQLNKHKVSIDKAGNSQGIAEKSVTVISSGRGRGKSAALGIIAARWLHTQNPALQGTTVKVVVTAPSRDRVSTLLKHAHSEWIRLAESPQSNHALDKPVLPSPLTSMQAAKAAKTTAKKLREHLVFHAPDDLLQCCRKQKLTGQELFLIDEAASIPIPLVGDLLTFSKRVVLAATTAGYEGCGQGFRLRLLPALDKAVANYQHIKLHQPIRWPRGDPLETFIERVFLLASTDTNVKAEEIVKQTKGLVKQESFQFQEYSAEVLLSKTCFLRQIFQLLTMAHYRTTPDDLRTLLDCPEVRLFAAQTNGYLVGCLLLSEELPFTESELRENIWAGTRRPKGHLIQQSLAQQLNIKAALALPAARIIRIAVHPAEQGRGIGSWMLQQLPAHFRPTTALQGTSYSTELLVNRFWVRNGYQLVRLGLQRDSYSGSHSALMLKPVTAQGQLIAKHAQQRFVKRCCYDKRQQPDNFASITKGFGKQATLTINCEPSGIDSQDLQELLLFAEGKRAYPMVMDTLLRAAKTPLSFRGSPAWQLCIVQQISQSETALKLGLQGKKAVTDALRRATADWLDDYRSESHLCTINKPTKD